MLKLAVRISCLILVSFLSLAACAQEFSADMVSTYKQGKTNTSQIYVAKDKMRVESFGEKKTGAAVIDFAHNTEMVVMTEQHMYMEIPMHQLAQSAMTFWRPDATDACPQWQKIAASIKDAKHQLVSCHKLGNDVVNGRAAVKYEGSSSDGNTATVWIDPKLRFVLKMHDKNGDFDLRNIKEGAQSASLFEPPAGYRKFDVGQKLAHPAH
ncbi:MAG: hypothetical protein LAN63_03675 [Acidobacteriia bacterium]|nr:hypothetical protein [Terriglobia bacterium]